jgi:transposase-like protein
MRVNTEGRRGIVGLHIGPSEAEVFWSDFLKSPKGRGLTGIKLVISDAHEGLKAAIVRILGATWQRCRVHWTRNALAYVPKGQHTMVAAALRQAFRQPDHAAARTALLPVAEMMRALAEARRLHHRQRSRCARLHDLPQPAPNQAALHQPVGTPQ